AATRASASTAMMIGTSRCRTATLPTSKAAWAWPNAMQPESKEDLKIMNNSDSSPQPNSIAGLLRELRDETTTLMRQEVALAKTEIKENVSRMGGHAAHIAVGGFVAYAGVIVLLIGIGHLLGAVLVKAGMSDQLAQWLAP